MKFDEIPLWLLFVGTTTLVIVAIELGYLTGNRSRRKSEEEKESPVGAIAGTVLALLAFILAFTFGMVANRFDARKDLVRDQAALIRTSFDRSDFLPQTSRDEAQALYLQYIDLVVEAGHHENGSILPDLVAQLHTIQVQLWNLAVENVRGGDNSDISALYVESVNDMTNVLATRLNVAAQTRMPTGIWLVLFALVGLGVFAVGYQTAIAVSRRSWMLVVLALSFGIVITMIAALDNPQLGYLPVSQRPLVDLQTEMHASIQP